ncbi:type IV secretion system protein [Xenophilus arseniciresistens]|uniref:Type IV secretion system protein n=1 Tax=Xenophilus arseniciresistens TaxID=1283306 RepID=A0AAE3NA00_9BURK|nr:type IV secretion system protein [Xenophilus arseniciresistens]MDA7418435.1 type IV secretion system protein [Xenophilus arseniciresistens]
MLKRKPSSSKMEDAISQSVNFELSIAEIAARSERRAWWVACCAIVMALILLGGYFYILPLKEKVPYLVIADAYTGTSTAARLTDEGNLQRITTSEAINRSNVAHYIAARESYDLALTNLRDWTTVLTMSSPEVASGYTNLYSELNPVNPYKVYGKNRAIRTRILSITLIGGSASVPPSGATVRFQRSVFDKQTGGTQPLDAKIATLAFTYKANLKMNEQQRIENPLGFQVTDYRVDSDFASPPPEEALPLERATESASRAPFAPEASSEGASLQLPSIPAPTAPAPPLSGAGLPSPTSAATAPIAPAAATPRSGARRP